MSGMAGRVNRRVFVKGGAAGASFVIAARHVLGRGAAPPSEKLNIAGIGVGAKGFGDMRSVAGEHNVVALCDVDQAYAAPALQHFPKAAAYQDYRRLLDREKSVDAVMIATPDHTHAVIAMAALRCGKHVFCQKPLCHNVYEARVLAKAARESKVCTTMGIQGHSGEGVRLICEWIWAGVLGDVYEVEAYCPLSTYSSKLAIGYAPDSPHRPTDTPPVPATLDWDLWIGPAPMRPYHPNYHPRKWLAWWDFGTGMLGGRGVHVLDPVMWALKLDAPETIAATSLALNPETYPPASIVTYRFPARGGMPPLTLKWYDGLTPPRPAELEDDRELQKPDGVIFRGSKGVMICGMYGGSPRLIPESRMQEFLRNQPPKTLPRVKDHYWQWLEACKKGTKADADFEYSAKLTELCLLGLVATRVNSFIRWDAANMRVTNLEAANAYLRRDYRKGWSLG